MELSATPVALSRVRDLTPEIAAAQYQSIASDAMEMARLKSALDCDKFTVAAQGPYLAHQFHMLMRQLSLAALELQRLVIDREVVRRRRAFLINDVKDDKTGHYPDLEQQKCDNHIAALDLSIREKQSQYEYFNQMRTWLIDQHDNKPFTDAEYQAEEPAYWAWRFQQMIDNVLNERATGVPANIWKNVDSLRAPGMEAQHQLSVTPTTINLPPVFIQEQRALPAPSVITVP